MREFHDFLNEIYTSTNIPFNVILNNGAEIKFLSNELSKDKVIEKNLDKDFKIITSKNYESCIPLLKYLIENKIKDIKTNKEKILVDLLENNYIDLEAMKISMPWLLENTVLITIFSNGDNKDILSMIKQSYSNYNIIAMEYSNYVMVLCHLDDIEEHIKGLRDSIHSNLYVKCYISYCEVNNIKSIKDKANENINRINLAIKYNLSESIYDEKSLMVENIVSGINDKIKKHIIKNFSLGFSKLDGDMVKTIDVFLKSGLNITDASKRLYIHRNTLIYRLDKIEKYTGYDLRNFNEAMFFKIALLICLEQRKL